MIVVVTGLEGTRGFDTEQPGPEVADARVPTDDAAVAAALRETTRKIADGATAWVGRSR